LSEIALWLIYTLSGSIAFLAIFFRRWRVVPSMLLGTAVAVAIYLAAALALGSRIDDPALGPALFTHGCFALVASFFGAALGSAVRRKAARDG
jgi:hypothetical protein